MPVYIRRQWTCARAQPRRRATYEIIHFGLNNLRIAVRGTQRHTFATAKAYYSRLKCVLMRFWKNSTLPTFIFINGF